MKRALLAVTALVASSFTPIAIPTLVSEAAALPSPNVLLCNDTRSLGPSENGHFWGPPSILPPAVTGSITFDGPFSSGDTEYFIATTTTTTAIVIQRCHVYNRSGQRTGKHQDVQLAPASTVVTVENCQPELTPAGEALGYVECGAGFFPDDRDL